MKDKLITLAALFAIRAALAQQENGAR